VTVKAAVSHHGHPREGRAAKASDDGRTIRPRVLPDAREWWFLVELPCVNDIGPGY
jgi:hypothetical protein